MVWSWTKDEDRYLIAVNLSDYPLQAQVQVPWTGSGGATWQLSDVLSGVTYERDGNALLSPGLYVDLKPWDYHFLQFVRTAGK